MRMRTMFAVGHQSRTQTRIVITGRLREERRADAPSRERPVASDAPRREVPVAVPTPTSVH